MDRRKVLGMSGAVLASSLTGCIGGIGGGNGNGESDFSPINMTTDQFKNTPKEDYEDKFNMWNWYNNYRDWATKKLPKDFKGLQTVNGSGYSSGSQWYSKLQSGNYQIDNISGKIPFTPQAMEKDQISPIPVNEMPNWKYVSKNTKKTFKENLSKDGDIYAVPEVRGMGPTLGYNSDRFDKPPESWSVLWDEEYKGKIIIENNAQAACKIAALHTGQDPFDPNDFKEIKEALIQQKPLIKTYWNQFANARRLFVNESIVAGQLTRGQLFKARFQNDAKYIDYTVPKEGAFIFTNHYIIPSKAPNPKISTLYCNWAMKPENAVKHFTKNGYVPDISNLKQHLVDAGVSKEEADFIQTKDDAKLLFIPPIPKETRDKYSSIWTDVQAA